MYETHSRGHQCKTRMSPRCDSYFLVLVPHEFYLATSVCSPSCVVRILTCTSFRSPARPGASFPRWRAHSPGGPPGGVPGPRAGSRGVPQGPGWGPVRPEACLWRHFVLFASSFFRLSETNHKIENNCCIFGPCCGSHILKPSFRFGFREY